MLPHLNQHPGGFGVTFLLVIISLDDHQVIKTLDYSMYSVHFWQRILAMLVEARRPSFILESAFIIIVQVSLLQLSIKMILVD